MQNPCQHYFQAATHLLRYVKGTLHYVLHYPTKLDFTLTGFCDADWAKCKISRKSITCYCILLEGCLISWKTKKQTIVSRFSVEVEYRSMGHTTYEIKWISYMLTDFQIAPKLQDKLFRDNQATLAIAKNPLFHERTKHIEIGCHVIRNHIEEVFIQIVFCQP